MLGTGLRQEATLGRGGGEGLCSSSCSLMKWGPGSECGQHWVGRKPGPSALGQGWGPGEGLTRDDQAQEELTLPCSKRLALSEMLQQICAHSRSDSKGISHAAHNLPC